jgi:uncharacterized protein YkwD
VENLTEGESHSELLLDQLRGSLELRSLVRYPEMDAFARDWSRQMAESGQLAHSNGPHGENIAFTRDTTLTASEAADAFHQLWLGSPGHYENMTRHTYVTVGIGLFLTEHGWYGTQVFNYF